MRYASAIEVATCDLASARGLAEEESVDSMWNDAESEPTTWDEYDWDWDDASSIGALLPAERHFSPSRECASRVVAVLVLVVKRAMPRERERERERKWLLRVAFVSL